MQQKGPLNIAILGAGLIGVYGGAFAQRAGAKVTYVGRPRIQEQVKRHGILISTFQPSPDVPSEEFHLPPEDVKFVTELPSRAESAFDYIVVCLKCGATEDGAKAIVTGGHADPSLPAEERAKVVTFQNGARNPSILRDNLPPGTIVLAGSWPFNVAPGQRPGEFHQGVLGALKLENSPHAEPLQQILVKGGLPTDLFDDMEAHLYGKLLTNANNAVNALSGLTLKQQLSQRDYRLVVVETQKEGLEVLNKAGIKYLGLPAGGLEGWMKVMLGPDEEVAKMIKVDPKAGSSMADDFANQRPTEIDELNGHLAELGRKYGIPTPWNDTIISLVKHVHASYGPDFKPPRYSGRELIELCEKAAKALA